MGVLTKIKNESSNEEIQGETDSLGNILDSDAYAFTIKMAYKLEKESGSIGAVFQLEGTPLEEDGKALMNTTEWYISKKGVPYWERDGKKTYLQGYNNLVAIAEVTDSGDLDVEKRTIPIYDFDKRKEVPTSVEVFVDLIGKKFIAGVTRTTVDKNVKDNAGNYVPSGETRDENAINKVFSEDGLTTTELKAGIAEPTFLNAWLDKYKGKVLNKAKGVKAGSVPAGPAPQAAAVQKSGLFQDE